VGKPVIKMRSKHLLNHLPWRRYVRCHHPHVHLGNLVCQLTDLHINRHRNSTHTSGVLSVLLSVRGRFNLCRSFPCIVLCRPLFLNRTISHVHLGEVYFDGVQAITCFIFVGRDARRAGFQLHQRQALPPSETVESRSAA